MKPLGTCRQCQERAKPGRTLCQYHMKEHARSSVESREKRKQIAITKSKTFKPATTSVKSLLGNLI